MEVFHINEPTKVSQRKKSVSIHTNLEFEVAKKLS